MPFVIALVVSFVLCAILVPVFLGICKIFGLYDIVQERRCHVYVLFGNVVGTIDQPGLHFLFQKLGVRAFLVRWLGKRHVLDMRLDQDYLRSQPVNSEEGAPMGIGIWYEMYISCLLYTSPSPRDS